MRMYRLWRWLVAVVMAAGPLALYSILPNARDISTLSFGVTGVCFLISGVIAVWSYLRNTKSAYVQWSSNSNTNCNTNAQVYNSGSNVNANTNCTTNTTTRPAYTTTNSINQQSIRAILPDGQRVTLWCQNGFRKCFDLAAGQYQVACGNPISGSIFANGAGNAVDLDWLYRRQMKEPLRQAGMEWEGWHGFRRGLATNLERIGVRESIAAMILRHTNDRVKRKHYIKPAPVEAIAAMRQLSETFAKLETPKLLANDPQNAPQTPESDELRADGQWLQ